MATKGKKASRDDEENGAEVEESTERDGVEETAATAGDYEIPERPNRVLHGIGWGLGRGTRAVHDGLVWIGATATGALKGNPHGGEQPPAGDPDEDEAQTDESERDEAPADEEASEE